MAISKTPAETIKHELGVLTADINAGNVDSLTLGAAMRLVEAIKNEITINDTVHGGKSAWAREMGLL